ncbi:MAG: HEAT repeat domain-containing protein [Polyangiaceae bacterium]
MSTRWSMVFGRTLRVLLGALAISMAVARPAPAQDPAAAIHELNESSDFRIRVNAALVLGRSGAEGAREALEHALGDAHPAVRIAAATALGYLGDPLALAALERRLPGEPSPGVAAQLHASIERLRQGAAPAQAAPDPSPRVLPQSVRYVVRLGTMRNVSGVRGDDLRRVLRDSARSRARSLREAVVVESDASLLRQAAERHLPIVTLDANLTQLVESRIGGSLQVQARVEFTVRRDQTLRGTLSGGATTFGSGPTISDQSRHQLEEDAVDGAVQSALRGADQGLMVAAR